MLSLTITIKCITILRHGCANLPEEYVPLAESPADDEAWPSIFVFQILQNRLTVFDGFLFNPPQLVVPCENSVPRQESFEPHTMRVTFKK